MRALLTSSADDEPGFHSNMPVSELTKHDTRAIEASVVSSAPPVAETEDGVMHEIRLTPTEPHGARGLEPLDLNSGIHLTKVRRPAREGPEAASCRTKARGKKADEPQRPLPVPPRSGQGHLNLLV